MSSLGLILGWKFNHAAGIRTNENERGELELTEWPEALGSFPTKEQIDTWTAEYEAHVEATAKETQASKVAKEYLELRALEQHRASDASLGADKPLRDAIDAEITKKTAALAAEKEKLS